MRGCCQVTYKYTNQSLHGIFLGYNDKLLNDFQRGPEYSLINLVQIRADINTMHCLICIFVITPMLYICLRGRYFFSSKITDINNSSPHCKGDKIDQNGHIQNTN